MGRLRLKTKPTVYAAGFFYICPIFIQGPAAGRASFSVEVLDFSLLFPHKTA
jgi:hypothetical protein